MFPVKIPSSQYDSLRAFILETEGQRVEMIVYGRHGERPICVDLVGSPGISGLTAHALAEAVERHFEGQSERVRLRTQFSLVAYPDIAGIFLEYSMEDHLLEFERATLEVPEQIMRLVRFLEEEPESYVEFRFGQDPYKPFKLADFFLSKRVEMAGSVLRTQCTQEAAPSLEFILDVAGPYLKRILNDPNQGLYVRSYVTYFKLEEENGVTYFRMYRKGQRFYSIEKDKLRSKNENS